MQSAGKPDLPVPRCSRIEGDPYGTELDAHERTIRLAPPLVIEPADLEWAAAQLAEELAGE